MNQDRVRLSTEIEAAIICHCHHYQTGYRRCLVLCRFSYFYHLFLLSDNHTSAGLVGSQYQHLGNLDVGRSIGSIYGNIGNVVTSQRLDACIEFGGSFLIALEADVAEIRLDKSRFEVRNPDATCNPYLAIAYILAAGLEGIEKKMTPPEELSENIRSISFDQTNSGTVDVLPMTLGEAINAFKADDFGKEVLSESVYHKILEAKKAEWKEFRTCITKWELDKYLNNF